MILVMMQVVVLTQDVMLVCSENYRVSNHTCVICDQGTYNPPGDDANGPDTYCQQVLCDENEYISNHTCQACPPGTYNSPEIIMMNIFIVK